MVIIISISKLELAMSSIDKNRKESLKEIFGSKFKNISELHQQDVDEIDCQNDLLGERTLIRIRNIKIDDIQFSKIVRNLNTTLDELVDSSHGLKLPRIAKLVFNSNELKAIDTIDSIFKIASHKNVSLINRMIGEIKAVTQEITSNSDNLRKELVDLQKLIEGEQDHDDPNHVQRMNLLRQVYAFNSIRLQSIEQLIETGSSALKNAQNFLKYTKPNIDFSLESKIKLTDIDMAMETFKTGYLRKIKFYNIALNLLDLGSRITFVAMSIFCLINAILVFGFGTDFGMRIWGFIGVVVIFATIFNVIAAMDELPEYEKNNYLNIYEFVNFDYFLYKNISKKFNSKIINILCPLLAIIPFIQVDFSKVNLYEINFSILLLLLSYIIWKLINIFVNKNDEILLEISNKFHEVYLSYIESINDK
mgnify:CR=1 FL=1